MGLSWGMKIALICGVLVIAAAASSYHFWVVAYYEKEMAVKDTSIANLEKDKKALETSNASLEESIKQRDIINKQMLEQMSIIQSRDAETQRKLVDAERRINSVQRANQLNTLRNSEKAELLLDKINKSANCEILNFGKAGSCKDGVWQPSP